MIGLVLDILGIGAFVIGGQTVLGILVGRRLRDRAPQ